jgi:hypothetical protein
LLDELQGFLEILVPNVVVLRPTIEEKNIDVEV